MKLQCAADTRTTSDVSGPEGFQFISLWFLILWRCEKMSWYFISPERRVTPQRCRPAKPASFKEHIQGNLGNYDIILGCSKNGFILNQPYLLRSFSANDIGVDPSTRFFEAAFFTCLFFLSFLLAFLLKTPFFTLGMGVHGDFPWIWGWKRF